MSRSGARSSVASQWNDETMRDYGAPYETVDPTDLSDHGSSTRAAVKDALHAKRAQSQNLSGSTKKQKTKVDLSKFSKIPSLSQSKELRKLGDHNGAENTTGAFAPASSSRAPAPSTPSHDSQPLGYPGSRQEASEQDIVLNDNITVGKYTARALSEKLTPADQSDRSKQGEPSLITSRADTNVHIQPQTGVPLPHSGISTQDQPQVYNSTAETAVPSSQSLHLDTAPPDTNTNMNTILNRADLEIDWAVLGEFRSFTDLTNCQTGEDMFVAIDNQRPNSHCGSRVQRVWIKHINPRAGEPDLSRQMVRTSPEAAFRNMIRRLNTLGEDAYPELLVTVKAWQSAMEA
ncbi:hypothetical protein LTR78_010384 [Recurvomyces mirabilis]|uniref:Uncharacterized protein n=1 Tax=Recurvomyces mirabilis TaxID=574656 RepID=A0AAE0WF36_9PEZI|nr:hypothetical protein LTR78_010384 [Recurvomyces mirabilis]KAK5150118.1 hypothetical protein LTS14_010381 [Recurvomyces mirabilis]